MSNADSQEKGVGQLDADVQYGAMDKELDLEICIEDEDVQKSVTKKRSTKQATDSSVECVGPGELCIGS